MLSLDKHWSVTLAFALSACVFALLGLALQGLAPTANPLMASGLLAASLVCTAVSFSRLAMRVRRLELENEGLIEEISQEFDRVKDKLEIFSDALAEPRSLMPGENAAESAPLRRVAVK